MINFVCVKIFGPFSNGTFEALIVYFFPVVGFVTEIKHVRSDNINFCYNLFDNFFQLCHKNVIMYFNHAHPHQTETRQTKIRQTDKQRQEKRTNRNRL